MLAGLIVLGLAVVAGLSWLNIRYYRFKKLDKRRRSQLTAAERLREDTDDWYDRQW